MLLQMQSEEEHAAHWGDRELTFLIDEPDLAARRFGRARLCVQAT